MSRRVFRSLVPVDDQWHTVDFRGPIVHVATRDEHLVEVWHIYDNAAAPTRRVLRVFGTGQTLTDDDSLFIGTAIAPGGHLVWHLFEQGGTR